MPSAMARPVACHTSTVDAFQCGVTMTLSSAKRGSSAAMGSSANTSRAAPAIRRAASAATSAAIWNVSLGYGQAEVAETVRDQLEKLSFHLGLLNISTPSATELAGKLASLAPDGLNRVFFTSGGSESNESVIRLSRLYFKLKGYKNKVTAIARNRGYHGSSTGAASLTGIEHFHEHFEPMMPNVRPCSSPPMTLACKSQRPARVMRSCAGRRFARASMKSSALDAVEWLSAVGALNSATSFSVHAATSTLS